MTFHVSPERLSAPSSLAMLTATATVMPGGEALLLLDGTGEAVPEAGQLTCSSGICTWRAHVWSKTVDAGRGWYALAIVDTLPRQDALLFDASGARSWHIDVAPRIWSSAGGLAARARAIGADLCEIFRYLTALLARATPADGPQARLLAAFAQDYLEAVAERSGFIEVLAEPLTGGLFLQGWAQNLEDAPLRWLSPDSPAAATDLTAAAFARPDVLSPARGLCLFHKDLTAEAVARHRGGHLEQNGRIFRLDLVQSAGPALSGAEATRHVAQMIPRLEAEPRSLSAFRRVCRPRYAGEDTLSGTGLPLAVGLDMVLRGPDGSLLVSGWMLDPDRRLRMVLIKSLQNRYARISDTWVRLPRPDLCTAFAADPRFAGHLDPLDVMHGFIAHVPPAPGTAEDTDIYLELVLDDDGCLFQPLRATPVAGAERVPQILSGFSPTEPELARIIDDHLVPFLAHLDPLPPVARRGAAARPIPLGHPRDPRPVTALMPCQSLDELQPVFGLLAGTPEAEGLDLTLIAPRGIVEQMLAPLEQAFRFYGLSGRVVIAPDRAPRTVWLDTALISSDAAHVLLWSPQALPKTPGWLAPLLAEARDVPQPGLISPALTYEDGSIRFGPAALGTDALGYGADWLRRGRPAAMPTAAAEVALIDRACLATAGGFAGHLFGDTHAHVDLAARLAATGAGVWCSGAVEFWMLDDPAAADASPVARILGRVDARLLARRGGAVPEDMLR